MAASVTILYLIRHGQVAKARPRSYNGQSDVPLSALGAQQMERLADWASSAGVTAVYCSDLQRTRSGADQVARRCVATVTVSSSLREKHFGSWEGLTYEEAEQRFPTEWRAWLIDPSIARPPGGETYREVEDRVVPLVRGIVSDHLGQTVLILAHGGVNRVLLCRALGLPLRQAFRIEQDYACVNRIDCAAGDRWRVALLNSALPGDPLRPLPGSDETS
ncbi:MAG TPA: alpha-ribazole phosphatase [Nitrospiria bacterium]|nr:alpha-ribazole phosphatase [Nitrospiria bacterium]